MSFTPDTLICCIMIIYQTIIHIHHFITIVHRYIYMQRDKHLIHHIKGNKSRNKYFILYEISVKLCTY